MIYFYDESDKFINALFSQEKTNASGNASAELIVDGKSWGVFTSLELLRLKSLLENSDLGDLNNMIKNIPVRSDSQIWNKTSAEEYQDREIFETNITSGVSKSTVKEDYILKDPNVDPGKTANYNPKVSVKTTVIDLGEYTHQGFSGEWSQRQRAFALKRRNDLLVAVIEALKECNKCEVEESKLTALKIFEYIFTGE